jgi:hypothetical protein
MSLVEPQVAGDHFGSHGLAGPARTAFGLTSLLISHRQIAQCGGLDFAFVLLAHSFSSPSIENLIFTSSVSTCAQLFRRKSAAKTITRKIFFQRFAFEGSRVLGIGWIGVSYFAR